MKQYIDKSAVVAEIEKRIRVCQDYAKCNLTENTRIGNKAQELELNYILSFINTLEVKENDLVEELDYNDYMTFFKEHPEYSNGDWGFEETWAFGQYCYTLGLNAQKAEEME